MPARDPRIDAYIQKAQPFARPILVELRTRLHAAVPGLEETIKWNAPFFLLGGRIFASVAAFKAHTKLLLWKADFKSAMPETVDFSALEDLPSSAAHARRFKESAATFAVTAPGGGAAKKAKQVGKPARKSARKNVAARK